MKLVFSLCLIFSIAMSFAKSDDMVTRKIYIRHADPQLILMILMGLTTPYTQPEMSTYPGIGGFSGGFGGGSNSGGSGGFSGSGFGGAGGGRR